MMATQNYMIMTTTMTMATTTTRKTLSSPPASLLFLFLSIATNSHTATSFLTPPTVSIASRYQPSPPTTTAPTSTPRQIITSLSLSGSDVSNLLYEEQEKLIVRRGELEESLVSNLAPLEAHVVKVRGMGNAGGFGGGKQNKNSGKNKTKNNNKLNNKNGNSNIKTNNFQAEGKAHAQVLQTEGILRLDNVLPPDAADSLRDYVSSLRQTSEREVQSGLVPPLHRFADVLLKSNRCDLPLPLGQSPLLTSALHSLLLNSPVSSVIESLFGRNAVLHEFSCLVSDPGSQRQVLHPDTPYIDGKGPVLYTCFVALQDVTPEMGPTTWMPGTHTKEAHEAFGDAAGGKDEFLSKQRAVSGTLKKGDCAIFDSRVLHCGTANRSHLKGGEGTSRALFYFSFKNPEVGYTGNPASIRPEIGRAMLTLGDLMEDLEGWDGRDGSECTLIERVGKSLI